MSIRRKCMQEKYWLALVLLLICFLVKPNKDHCKTKSKETQIICTLKIKVKAAHIVNWSFDLHYLWLQSSIKLRCNYRHRHTRAQYHWLFNTISRKLKNIPTQKETHALSISGTHDKWSQAAKGQSAVQSLSQACQSGLQRRLAQSPNGTSATSDISHFEGAFSGGCCGWFVGGRGWERLPYLLLLSLESYLQFFLLLVKLFNLSGQDIICIHGFNFLFMKDTTVPSTSVSLTVSSYPFANPGLTYV